MKTNLHFNLYGFLSISGRSSLQVIHSRLIISLTLILFPFSFFLAKGQVPRGFNYQAVTMEGSGDPIINTSLLVTITIQSYSLGGTIFWKELHVLVITNGFGLFSLVIGKGSKQPAQQLHQGLKTSINNLLTTIVNQLRGLFGQTATNNIAFGLKME